MGSALAITGLVTFIAAYHYFRIFNSWVESYTNMDAASCQQYIIDNNYETNCPMLISGIPFNDAYRYMDWLLTVPFLLLEILFVMEMDEDELVSKAWKLGVSSALMIIVGY